MDELLVILLLMLLVWFWWDSIGVKEAAREAGRRICAKDDLQFLDDTVALRRIRLRRDHNGRLQFLRWYHFDFSSDGMQRYQGEITMLGRQISGVQMEAYRITDGFG